MTESEVSLILSKQNAAVVAPAGHGKTQMITELIAALNGKALVLTHTNAGVDALRNRLRQRQVQQSKYRLSTISSFCIMWAEAYPCSSGIDQKLDVTSKGYHDDRTRGSLSLFRKDWVKRLLSNTYRAVIVDEYQDCMTDQHEIFLELNKEMHVYVFGDPLQAIFGWAGELPNWNNLGFEEVQVETRPWRWEHTNKELGEYLTGIREKIMPVLSGKPVSFEIPKEEKFIKWIPSEDNKAKWNKTNEVAILNKIMPSLDEYDSVLLISSYQKTQEYLSRQLGVWIQNDEKQNLDELFDYAERFDEAANPGGTGDINDSGCFDKENNKKIVEVLFQFIETCATHVSDELDTYKNHIESGDFDFSHIRKHRDFHSCLLAILEHGMLCDVLSALEYIRRCKKFKIYRLELYMEMERSIRMAQENGISVSEAAHIIRTNPAYRRSYSKFKMISSRTVLSKGLEFDCVVIDFGMKQVSGTDMYVAMTRAMKMIYVISGSNMISLIPPNERSKQTRART